ncbi:C69 family dipeptidase [Peptoniphilus sp. oral taxon 386]|uniref:C69 family dipeptidase n=1 Tax=Peptoniphilus sp. oral taxon 386 TaxID=652713 RepID=UPI0001DA9B5C|nr:C69 family dipeptidase [Peptoniphilus sp. oral taxon 386]EFI42341.1 dipeptidase A [Peptoniphilus sp. oral taxon 386 str. F0131]
MCTTILVGKNASYDGSTIVARIEDSSSGMFKAKKFIVVEPKEQPVHYKSVRTDCEIELPENPMRYTCLPNVKKWRGVWGACGINEKNVSVSATETITTNERVLGADPLIEFEPDIIKKGGIGEEDIIVITLPYIENARQGVERLGSLIEKYGTYESNGVAFQDVDEIWWFETIGGHHWIARKVPDDRYVVMPNQFGIDYFDLDDAFGEKKEFMCSSDLREFIKKYHLDLSMDGRLNPRDAFGSHTDEDTTYNTPRAWVMLRYFNPTSYTWDGPAADFKPENLNLPWSMVPEKKITIEDVKCILSNHYQGTPYDPYARYGDLSQRGKYRPIGINRDDVLALTQIRPYMPDEIRSIEWLAFGCNVFNAIAPFYSNITKTPEYLANTTLTPTIDNLYWANRIIATLCDPHFSITLPDVENYQMIVQSKAHEILNKYDEEFLNNRSKIKNINEFLEKANDDISNFLKVKTTDLLDKTLYTASCEMKNGYSRSDA